MFAKAMMIGTTALSAASLTADISLEYLLVDGGAAGGAGAGGGGGGGKVQEGSTTRARGVAYTVVIGAATATTAVDTPGANSNTSQFDTLVGLSSGGGGKYNAPPYSGSDGDSGGGGAGASRSGSGGTATGAGNNGAAGSASGSGPGGGGGGAGGAPSGGVGGAGITSTITGSSVTYGGGGDGALISGGSGADAVANRGFGGEGGWQVSSDTGGKGGSGVLIIAVADTEPDPTFSGGLTSSKSTARSGWNVFTVTAGTGTVTFN